MNSLITTQIPYMDRVFDQLWRGSCVRPAEVVDGETPTPIRPRADVFESENDFQVVLDLPGVHKDDLRVEIERGVLSVEADRRQKLGEGLQALHVERAGNARFYRSFRLGQAVDTEGIKARFMDGTLELTVPKTEKALPRRINVE